MKTDCPNCSQSIEISGDPDGGIACPSCTKEFFPKPLPQKRIARAGLQNSINIIVILILIAAFFMWITEKNRSAKLTPVSSTPERARWEYKYLEIDSWTHKRNDEIFLNPNATNFLELINYNEKSAGTFVLNDADLNRLGDDGWELVSSQIEPETTWPEVDRSRLPLPNFRAGKILLIFKREKK
jgi:hypothetical protein